MNPSDILLVGLKKSVTAFHRVNGTMLWKTLLPNGMGNVFITLVSDTQRVYASCAGAITCLDLFSGEVIWSDPLRGYGYGIAGLCLPETPAHLQSAAAAQIAADQAAASAAASSTAT